MKKTSILIFFVFLLFSNGKGNEYETLKAGFLNPEGQARPWTFWYWMYGAVSEKAITADLEAMKEAGLEGAYLMPIKDSSLFNPASFGQNFPNPLVETAPQLSEKWWKLVNHSFVEANRLGLKMGMHISDGFALAGGPWIHPEESMQKLVASELTVRGGSITGLKLPQPETNYGFYKDVAVLALPLKMKFSVIPAKINVRSTNPEDTLPFNAAGKAFRSERATEINFDFGKTVLVRNIKITPAGNNLQCQRFSVFSSKDGINYTFVKSFIPPRQGWQNTGFDYTFAIPPTFTQYIRMNWDPEGTEPGSEDLDAAKWKATLKVNKIEFGSLPKLNLWEGKAGLVWRISDKTTDAEIPENQCFNKDEIINLTQFYENGSLKATLPKGDWLILRIGHTSTGTTNATGGTAKGLECDKFSRAAVQKQFNHWFGAIYEHTDSAVSSKVLTNMHIDSWECGSQNWTQDFPTEFLTRRKYSLIDVLPVMLGYPIENVKYSEKVLQDVRQTINELLQENFFKVMVENAHSRHCVVSAESVAPTFQSDGLAHFGLVDLPMGEFWLHSPTHDKPNDMLDAISGAHIYGKNTVQAEGFTQLRTAWNESPQMLKALLDRNFALGLNKLFFHIFVHNPYENIRPGMTLDGIGLYFQRDQIWWKQSRAFIDYIARCQSLLQYGKPVVDLAVYTGEEIPSRAYTPDRLIPFLPGIFDEKMVVYNQERLQNTGNPTTEKPKGVTHSKGTFTLEQWSNPMGGYKYDSYNKSALWASKVLPNGKLLSPGGLEYAVLVVPGKTTMNPANIVLSDSTENLIKHFKNGGLKIPELPYLQSNFSQLGIEPDLICASDIAWTHRQSDSLDIYFLSNQSGKDSFFNFDFRKNTQSVEIWNAQQKEIRSANIQSEKGRTKLQLRLLKDESVFVVFSNQKSSSKEEIIERIDTVRLNENWKIELPRNSTKMERSNLFDLSTSEKPEVKFYSGEIIYTNSFDIQKLNKSKNIVLDLGKLSNLATVTINGMECGILWTSPFVLDISKAVVKGKNEIKIEVTNTWANALMGADAGTPPYDTIFTNGKYRKEGLELESTGLIGPVQILTKTYKRK